MPFVGAGVVREGSLRRSTRPPPAPAVVDHETRLMLLRRLPVVGCQHSRWHVGEVFARVVGRLTDRGEIVAVRDILDANHDVARWCKHWLDNQSVPAAIKQLLVRASTAASPIPFLLFMLGASWLFASKAT